MVMRIDITRLYWSLTTNDCFLRPKRIWALRWRVGANAGDQPRQEDGAKVRGNDLVIQGKG